MTTTFSTGTNLGRYRILSRLGAGGMGEVYLAQDTRLSRKVALKILPAELINNRERLHRFEKEAQAASALNHPNIITIHEIGAEADIHFIATEFIDGETLRQKMQRNRLEIEEAINISIQIAVALENAHRCGVIHRDIKPANIMLREDDLLKVLDFGLAKFAEQQVETLIDTQAATRALIKTTPGVVMGTVAYMSPEQARAQEADRRTDLFSLGVVMYEMLTRRLPFSGATTSDMIVSILTTEPTPPAKFNPEVPAELERIVSKSLAKDREERYQTATDLLVDLRNLKKQLKLRPLAQREGSPDLQPEDVTQLVAPRPTSPPASGATSTARRNLGFGIAISLLLLATVVLGYWFLSNRPSPSSSIPAPIESVAVLPFVDESGNADTEYLSDGMTVSLINNLSQLPNLTVKARSSVFRYKGKELDPQVVGRELGVQAVLLGRMTQHGDGLTLSLELVDARTGNHLWGEQYIRKLDDLVAVQSEIARDVLEKLRQRLTSVEQQLATKSFTASTEAYQLYLKGNYYLDKRTDEGYQKSIDFFRQAIDRDPTYALAYAGLADAYSSLIGHSVRSAEETLPLAKAAATRAVQLDPTLAEAYNALADLKLRYDWDWAAAEQAFKQAISLNSNYASAHRSYAYLLISTERTEEAFAEIRRAQDLDPLSLNINADYGEIYFFARRPDQAIEQLRKVVEMDASFVRAHFLLGRAYAQKGQCEESLAEFQKARELDPESVEMSAALGLGYAWCGKKEGARRALNELLTISGRRYVSPHLISVIYAALGDLDKGFEWLDKAFDKRFGALIYLKVNPIWDPLRSDPRFAERLRRIGLTP